MATPNRNHPAARHVDSQFESIPVVPRPDLSVPGGSAAAVGPATHVDDRAEDEDDPTIMLGRRAFIVPEFTWRELTTLMPQMRRCTRVDFANLTEADMLALGDLMWMVVERTNSMTREAFDRLPIRLNEILLAIPIVTKQAGMERATPGEEQAAGSV